MKPTNYWVLDFETTGLRPESDRILEIGLMQVYGKEDWGLLSSGRRIDSRLVNPRVAIPEIITEITGIKQADVEEKASMPSALIWLVEIMGIMNHDPIVGHNILAFDVPFLEAECQRAGVPSPLVGHPIIDTAALFLGRDLCIPPWVGETPEAYARRVIPKGYYNHRKYNLQHCAKTLGVSMDGVQLHRAAGDVLLTHRVFEALPEQVEVERPRAMAVVL